MGDMFIRGTLWGSFLFRGILWVLYGAFLIQEAQYGTYALYCVSWIWIFLLKVHCGASQVTGDRQWILWIGHRLYNRTFVWVLSINVRCRFPRLFFWTKTCPVNQTLKLAPRVLLEQSQQMEKLACKMSGKYQRWLRTRDTRKALGMCRDRGRNSI